MANIPDGEPPLAWLLYTLPPRAEDVDADAVLDRFLEYVGTLGLELYPAQEEALLELFADRNVLLATPTGSGKSLVATAAHFHALALGRRSYYTAPTKALVAEKFFNLCRDFGPQNVALVTGDASVNREAPIVCCTAEILANVALREGASADVGDVVADEFHYYSDRERGVAWQVPLLALPQARFLLMSATFGDTTEFEARLTALNGRESRSVTSTMRPVPLDFSYEERPLHETLHALIGAGKAPVYIVNFTQKACAEVAQDLMSTDFCTKDEKKALAGALRGVRFDSVYGKDVQRFVRAGVGIHHAGLLPRYRLLVEKLAQRGFLKVIVGTDTLGVGVNIPIRTVLLTKLCKFDGAGTSILSARDFHQIVGRAGRRGFDTKGSVVAQAPEHVIENRRLEAKAGNDPVKLKRIVRKKPPERGYVPWNQATFEKLIAAPPEPLVSRFDVSHGMVLNLLSRERGGCRAIARLIKASHEPRRRQRQLGKRAVEIIESLEMAGVVERDEWGRLALHEDLQLDFSLHQALALYLVETLERLDRDDPDYPLHLLSLVEAVQENPTMILLRQEDELKRRTLIELKAAGVEYEDRMAELEKISYPKPDADFIYDTYNEYVVLHPWAGATSIHPKSVAREMYENLYAFKDYIREYGLERSEGLLLRYLSETYRTLLQTVPGEFVTAEVEDVIDFFRAVVSSADSSLIEEWERLVGSSGPRPEQAEESVRTDADRVDITTNERGLVVLLRNALFGVVRALARGQYDLAAAAFEPGEDPWPGRRIGAALEPFFAEHAELLVTPAARSPSCLRIVERGERYWKLEQLLKDPEEHDDWYLACRLDLEASRDQGRPVLLLDHVGS